MMEVVTADLRATGIESRAPKAGNMAPDLILTDALNRPVRLATLWAHGPWC